MKTVCGNDLTIEDVCDVALKGEEVKLPEDKAFWETIEKSRKFLEDYIATGEGRDKAGSYAIQGIFGKYIEKYVGDYDNVVGLPGKRVKEELLKL